MKSKLVLLSAALLASISMAGCSGNGETAISNEYTRLQKGCALRVVSGAVSVDTYTYEEDYNGGHFYLYLSAPVRFSLISSNATYVEYRLVSPNELNVRFECIGKDTSYTTSVTYSITYYSLALQWNIYSVLNEHKTPVNNY